MCLPVAVLWVSGLTGVLVVQQPLRGLQHEQRCRIFILIPQDPRRLLHLMHQAHPAQAHQEEQVAVQLH